MIDMKLLEHLTGDDTVFTKAGTKWSFESEPYDEMIAKRVLEQVPKTKQEFFTLYEAEFEETFLMPFEGGEP